MLGDANINPYNCLLSLFSSCGNWVLLLAHWTHIQDYDPPKSLLCCVSIQHPQGPLRIPGKAPLASCCLSKALLKWHLHPEARPHGSTPESPLGSWRWPAHVVGWVSKSTVSSPKEEGRDEIGPSPLLCFPSSVHIPVHCFQLTEEIGLPILTGRHPWFLLSSEVVFRGKRQYITSI